MLKYETDQLKTKPIAYNQQVPMQKQTTTDAKPTVMH